MLIEIEDLAKLKALEEESNKFIRFSCWAFVKLKFKSGHLSFSELVTTNEMPIKFQWVIKKSKRLQDEKYNTFYDACVGVRTIYSDDCEEIQFFIATTQQDYLNFIMTNFEDMELNPMACLAEQVLFSIGIIKEDFDQRNRDKEAE